MTTGQFNRVKLNAAIVESFAGIFLSPMYDNPQPTPDLHRQCWGLYCTDTPYAAIAAPREHAKSTALTHDYGLAVSLFREQDFIIIVSNTEGLAVEHLSEIAKVFRDNEEVRSQFGVDSLPTDNNSDLVVRFTDGHECRFIAKGSGQKMRGLKWNGKRPGLILCHKVGTQIYDYDLGWMSNSDHPTAKPVETDCYRVALSEDDGHNEEVSAEHYYLARTSLSEPARWVQTQHLKVGDLIGMPYEPGCEDRLSTDVDSVAIGAQGEGRCTQEGVGAGESGQGSCTEGCLDSKEPGEGQAGQACPLRAQQGLLQREGNRVLEESPRGEATTYSQAARCDCQSHTTVGGHGCDTCDHAASQGAENERGSHRTAPVTACVGTARTCESANSTNEGEPQEVQQRVAGYAVADGFIWRPVTNLTFIGKGLVVAVRTKTGFYKTAFGMSHNCDDL